MGKKKHLRVGAEKRFDKTREKFDERLTSQGVLRKRFNNKKSGITIGEIILECTRSRRKLVKKPDKKSQIEVKRDCFVTFQNGWLPFVPLEMYSYTRTCKEEDENYKYFELHRESSIISYIGEKDKVLKSIIKRENLNDAQGKMFKRALEYTQRSVRTLDPVYKDFTYHWLEKYKPKKSPKLMGFKSNMLLDCPKLNVVYSILGYSLLAYIRTKCKIGTKIIPINFVIDKKSAKILKEIISGCFVWTGERDDEDILEVAASSKTVLPERLTEGRCVIVNAMGKDRTALESGMPLYFEYYNENERPVVFPYAFLPIIISDKPMGKEFVNIDAKGLNDHDWYAISEILNKVYESPIYRDFNRKEEKQKKHPTTYTKFAKEHQMSFKFINSVYKDYGLTRRQFVMSALIKCCCLWAAESLHANEDVIAELKHSISMELLTEIRLEEPKKAAPKVKETCVDEIEEANMVKIVKKINDLIEHGDKRILKDKPQSADEAKEAVAFYTKVKDEVCIAFHDKFFNAIAAETFVSEKYSVDEFQKDCDNYGMRIFEPFNKVKRRPVISFKKGCARCIALKINEQNQVPISETLSTAQKKAVHQRQVEVSNGDTPNTFDAWQVIIRGKKHSRFINF